MTNSKFAVEVCESGGKKNNRTLATAVAREINSGAPDTELFPSRFPGIYKATTSTTCNICKTLPFTSV